MRDTEVPRTFDSLYCCGVNVYTQSRCYTTVLSSGQRITKIEGGQLSYHSTAQACETGTSIIFQVNDEVTLPTLWCGALIHAHPP
jgi:hypothetical protein